MSDGFTVTRVINAPRELVWDAWTLPEHFSRWFGTEAVNVPLDSVVMDVRPGGKLAATMVFDDGNKMEWFGEYRVVDRRAASSTCSPTARRSRASTPSSRPSPRSRAVQR